MSSRHKHHTVTVKGQLIIASACLFEGVDQEVTNLPHKLKFSVFMK